MRDLKNKTQNYEIVIGLEVHLQLNTKSKVFCGCGTNFGAAPNTQTCPVCLGMPGSLPVLNREALAFGAKAAVALNCKIAKKIRFDRKNYFYPDLPKAFQISQFNQPLSRNGYVTIFIDGKEKRVGITRVHLEEDTGKLFHQKDSSFVDFNRSGTPLLEIVSEPDMNSPDEAYEYLTVLKAILKYLDVSDCNMEEGSLRCDANISVRKPGAKEFGVKTEIKNMNSFKAVKAALEYEAKRQMDLLDAGQRIVQETRLYDSARCVTESMRSKEEAHDYRYFPEPDLVPFDFDEDFLEGINDNMPELPEARKKRFMSEYNLSDYDSAVMVNDKSTADYFEKSFSLYGKAKVIVNWLMGDIYAYMKEKNISAGDLKLKEEHFTDMLKMIDGGIINGKIGKTLLIDMIETGKAPAELVKERGMEQISNDNELEQIIQKVIAENAKSVDDFRKGKENAIMFLVGRVMAMTKGKANPEKVNSVLREKLKGDS
jgi:aspartyl-tRNA(Asn)/glutamyl-tRNA(Gln) amidotransferase subunit B